MVLDICAQICIEIVARAVIGSCVELCLIGTGALCIKIANDQIQDGESPNYKKNKPKNEERLPILNKNEELSLYKKDDIKYQRQSN
jgi:hypothetical protein